MATLGQRLAEEPHRLMLLFGPRQTGKTTIVQQALRKINHTPQKYLAVDRPWPPATSISPFAGDTHLSPPRERDVAWLEERWVEAREEEARYGRSVLVVDEIQKIPGWSETVKGLWDADRDSGCPLHVVVLGSAPLLMQSGLTESLTGCFESVPPVTHWSFLEIADAFGLDLEQYLYSGAYPGAARYVSDESRWRSYVANSIIDPTNRRIRDSGLVETVCFLVAERGLVRSQAFSLASIAVDFRIAEAVDLTQVVTALVRKSVFVD